MKHYYLRVVFEKCGMLHLFSFPHPWTLNLKIMSLARGLPVFICELPLLSGLFCSAFLLSVLPFCLSFVLSVSCFVSRLSFPHSFTLPFVLPVSLATSLSLFFFCASRPCFSSAPLVFASCFPVCGFVFSINPVLS